MNRTLPVKYLKFFPDSATTLMPKGLIEDYDVASLQRELGQFKSRFRAGASGSAAIDASIAALELKADERDADGEKMGLLRVTTKLRLGRGLAWTVAEEKRQPRVRRALEEFRKEISHFAFAIEA